MRGGGGGDGTGKRSIHAIDAVSPLIYAIFCKILPMFLLYSTRSPLSIFYSMHLCSLPPPPNFRPSASLFPLSLFPLSLSHLQLFSLPFPFLPVFPSLQLSIPPLQSFLTSPLSPPIQFFRCLLLSSIFPFLFYSLPHFTFPSFPFLFPILFSPPIHLSHPPSSLFPLSSFHSSPILLSPRLLDSLFPFHLSHSPFFLSYSILSLNSPFTSSLFPL